MSAKLSIQLSPSIVLIPACNICPAPQRLYTVFLQTEAGIVGLACNALTSYPTPLLHTCDDALQSPQRCPVLLCRKLPWPELQRRRCAPFKHTPYEMSYPLDLRFSMHCHVLNRMSQLNAITLPQVRRGRERRITGDSLSAAQIDL